MITLSKISNAITDLTFNGFKDLLNVTALTTSKKLNAAKLCLLYVPVNILYLKLFFIYFSGK
jgi:hypothetical protein